MKRTTPYRRRTDGGRVALWIVASAAVVFLLAPIAVIVVVSFNDTTLFSFPPTRWSLRWYRSLWESRSWREAGWLSLWLAVLVTATSLCAGVPAGYGLARGRFRGKRFVAAFLMSPMVVPIIVLALGLYMFFAPLRLVGSPVALFLGHTVLAMPVVIVIVAAAYERVDPAIELAARSCGASFLRAFWHISIPAARPAIVSGGAFAFLTSFDEVVLALFLGGPYANTLPKRIWEAVKFELDPSLTAVSTVLVAISVAALVVAEIARRTRHPSSATEAR